MDISWGYIKYNYLEEVLGAVLDAGGAVGVLSVGVLLPLVLDGVVALHGRALLLAHPVVVEVPAGKAVGLRERNRDRALICSKFQVILLMQNRVQMDCRT